MIMTLTKLERDKFAAWLCRNAEVGEAISRKMSKMGGAQQLMADHLEAEAEAFRLVARKLERIEDLTIG